ncbi:MAG: alpha-hydroxy-acid oxidizing protein [Solirubrobacteraceae bacterium MAG38_C4-C5]|nr:alpha-hydroxy-acid oxidizing protein [Candidatus Siliceabacter maunaloa]
MDLLRRQEALARERLDPAVHDYFAGGAGDEQTLADNERAWRRWWIRPRGLVDVGAVDTAVEVLGARLRTPILVAPVAAHALLHHDGERAGARAAGAAGSLFTLSTRATTDLADVAAAADGPLWLQVYVDRDRERTLRVLAGAREHGVGAVVLTVDLPVAGRRERELRNGELPLPDGVRLADHLGGAGGEGTKPLAGWDPTLTWADLAWIREACGLPVAVKGVLTAQDARAAVEHGAAAVVVSNHGGRQLDGCVPTAVALEEVAGAVGGAVPVLVDGGIRDGGDVLRALALGARAVLVGRPYAWGLAAGGQDGAREALEALTGDLELAMALAGCPSLAAITRDHVRAALW